MRKLRLEYDTNVGPDDIKLRHEVQDFMQEYKALNPERNSPEEDVNELFTFDKGEFAPQSHREYLDPRPAPELNVEDSAKFGGAAMYPPRQ